MTHAPQVITTGSALLTYQTLDIVPSTCTKVQKKKRPESEVRV